MLSRERRIFTPSFPQVSIISLVRFSLVSMKVFLYLCYVCSAVSLETEEDRLAPENINELISFLERENLTPEGKNSLEHALYIWESAKM